MLLGKGRYRAGLNRVSLSFRNFKDIKVRRRAGAAPQATRGKPSTEYSGYGIQDTKWRQAYLIQWIRDTGYEVETSILDTVDTGYRIRSGDKYT